MQSPQSSPFPPQTPSTQSDAPPVTQSTTQQSKNAPLRGTILEVKRDLKPGSSEIVYSIKLQLQHNNDIRIIVDNHTINKQYKPTGKSQSLYGAWIGTMLDTNLVENDEVVLNVIHKQQAIWQKVDSENSVLTDINAVKKKQRKRAIDIDTLLGSTGLAQIYYKFDTTKFNMKPNNEISDLNLLISMYKEWLHSLCPKLHYQLLLQKLEKFGHNKRVRNYMNNLRIGKLPEECDQIYTGYIEQEGMTPYAKRRKSAHTIDEDDEMRDFIVNAVDLNDDEEQEYVDVNQYQTNKVQLHKAINSNTVEPQTDAEWQQYEAEKDSAEHSKIIDPFAESQNENIDNSNIDSSIQISKPSAAPVQVVSLFDALDDW